MKIALPITVIAAPITVNCAPPGVIGAPTDLIAGAMNLIGAPIDIKAIVSVEFQNTSMSNGLYYYSLYVDGNLIASNKMILKK